MIIRGYRVEYKDPNVTSVVHNRYVTERGAILSLVSKYRYDITARKPIKISYEERKKDFHERFELIPLVDKENT